MAKGIDRIEIHRLIESEDAQVVDVLPRGEYDESHLAGAVSIPLRELTAETVSGLSRTGPVVVYCHDGL
jgi:rhodanese-related sulfurtransferase